VSVAVVGSVIVVGSVSVTVIVLVAVEDIVPDIVPDIVGSVIVPDIVPDIVIVSVAELVTEVLDSVFVADSLVVAMSSLVQLTATSVPRLKAIHVLFFSIAKLLRIVILQRDAARRSLCESPYTTHTGPFRRDQDRISAIPQRTSAC